MTVIVENMQTVFEGLNVNCKIASVDDFEKLAIICLVMTFCSTFPGICFHLAVFFLKLILPIKNTSKFIKKHVYIIYININISIYCISFFVKAVLSYKCMDAMHHGLLNKM